MRILGRLMIPLLMTLTASWGQENVDLESLIRLLKEGFPDDVLIDVVKTAKSTNFDVSPDGLVLMKRAGLSLLVINAIRERQTGLAGRSAPAAPASPPASSSRTQLAAGGVVPGLPGESGVYYQHQGRWIRLEEVRPEMKTKGGSLIRANLDPFHKMSHVYVFPGAAAPLEITESRPTFHLRRPDFSPRDVMIVSLDRKKRSREVEYGSVGLIGGVRSGLKKDKLREVTASRVAGDVIKVTPVRDLAPGQYALGLGAVPVYDFGITRQ